MEVAVKELNAEGKESALVTHGKHDGDECNHFTIRGYVAGVRKRDAKICWPLYMAGNESSDALSSMLPPLHVSKFKRWSCLNCLHTICASADVTGSVNFTNVCNEDMKTNNSIFLFDLNAKRLFFSGPKQSFETVMLEERPVSDCIIKVSHGEHSPVPYHGNKNNESKTDDAAKEGYHVFTYRNFRTEEKENHSCKSITAVAEGEEFQAGQSQKRNMTNKENKFKAALLFDDASPKVGAEPNGGMRIGLFDATIIFRGTDLAACENKDDEGITAKGNINIVPDGMTKESRKLVGVDLCIPEDDVLTTTAANLPNYDLMTLDQNNDEASYGNKNLSDGMYFSRNQKCVSSSSHRKVTQKRVLKLRLLEDIMKNEELHISKKIHTFKGSADTCEKSHKRSDEWKCEIHPEDYKKGNFFRQNCKVIPAKPINATEATHSKDEEISLMHWLKKVSKKIVTDDSQRKKNIVGKGYAEIKRIENKVVTSPSTHKKKDADPLSKGSRASKYSKSCTVEKKSKFTRLKPSAHCLKPQLENLISKDASVKHVPPENVYPQLRNIISEDILPPCLENLERSCEQKSEFNRRKRKAFQVKDRNPSQINCSKKQVIKKQRNMMPLEKKTVDDIPMDIVELLAKNQHERSMMNAEVSNMNKHELSMMNGELRHGIYSNVTGYCGSKFPKAIYQRQANDTVLCIPTAPHGNQNDVYGPEACKAIEFQKHALIDLNQQAADFLAIPQYDGYQPCTTHHSAVDSKKTSSFQVSSWDRMRMQDSGLYQKNQGVSAQRSCGGPIHDMSSLSLNGRIFGVNKRNVDTCHNHGKMVPFDSFLDTTQKIVPRKTGYQEPVNLTSSNLPYGEGKSEQTKNGIALPGRSFLMERASRCHPGRAGPIDMHNKETVSALHLLRLVDQAAQSGTSWDINCTGITQDSRLNHNRQSSEMHGAEVGVKNRKTQEIPSATGYCAHDQTEGGFSSPCHPFPRIGALGSLLQNENMTLSYKPLAPLGSKAVCSAELPSFCIYDMDKIDAPSASSTKYRDNKNPPSVTTNTKQIVSADQVGINRKGEQVQPLSYDPMTITCVINRNPADFSQPDEDNIYMRGND
ncbi:uncharacterized protein LOC135582561 isoform X1 [Musa acuminata AAA Group]|uniref:uncharacterized protein LOC135582561 isoform X1 n=1 Tax=Musa acuminata AAA Group TaxID=214697 RepID=UPI0031CE6C01